jgi:hypothetical protein
MSIKCNLKYFVYGWIVTLCAMNLWADQTNRELAFVETKVVDGFFIGVTDEDGFTNTTPDRRLCFTIWAVTNATTHVVFPTQPEYAYQVDLFDNNGVAISKTELGKKAGTKFLDFGPNSFVLRSTGPDSQKHGIKAQMTIATEKTLPYEMFNMFRPSDFFDIKKSGNYTLQIRFQIIAFPRTGPNRGDHTSDLIRFPVLNYSFIKLKSDTMKQ